MAFAALSVVGVASRPSAVAPAPTGVLEDDRIPDFTSELNSVDRLTGSAEAVDEPAITDGAEGAA